MRALRRLVQASLVVTCAALAPSLGTPLTAVGGGVPSEEGYLPGADGARLFYRKFGHGPDVVIFLHGGPGLNMADGGPAMEPLADRHTLIMYDQRGGGRSTAAEPPDQVTAAADVRDLEAVRRYFGVKQVAIVGNSWGAGLAILYATAHPEHVTRLVLLSPMPPTQIPYAIARGAHLDSLMSDADRRRLRTIAQAWDSTPDSALPAVCRDLLGIVFKPYVLDSTHWQRRRGDVCDMPATAIRNWPTLGAATTRSLGNPFDLRPTMARIRVPALVIDGQESNLPLDATRVWAAAIPEALLLLVPHSGHAVFLDQPDAMIKAIEVFLGGAWPTGAVAGGGQ